MAHSNSRYEQVCGDCGCDLLKAVKATSAFPFVEEEYVLSCSKCHSDNIVNGKYLGKLYEDKK